MIRPVAAWLCIWTLAFHAAAVLAPALAVQVPRPVIQHTCPDPDVHHKVACPDPRAMANGAAWKCLHTTITDRCAEAQS